MGRCCIIPVVTSFHRSLFPSFLVPSFPPFVTQIFSNFLSKSNIYFRNGLPTPFTGSVSPKTCEIFPTKKCVFTPPAAKRNYKSRQAKSKKKMSNSHKAKKFTLAFENLGAKLFKDVPFQCAFFCIDVHKCHHVEGDIQRLVDETSSIPKLLSEKHSSIFELPKQSQNWGVLTMVRAKV